MTTPVSPARFFFDLTAGARSLDLPLEQRVEQVLKAIQERFSASQVGLVLTTRTAPAPRDMLRGWRPVQVFSTRPSGEVRRIRRLARALRWVPTLDLPGGGLRDRPGAHRKQVRELPEGSTHRWLAEKIGLRDRILIEAPVDEYVGALFLIDRNMNLGPFDPAAVEEAEQGAYVLSRPCHAWSIELGATDGCLLTPRELDVQRMVLLGESDVTGSDRLGLKPSSFRAVLARVYRKRGVSSRTELAARFLAPGRSEPAGPTFEIGLPSTAGSLK